MIRHIKKIYVLKIFFKHIKKIHNLDNYFHCVIKLNYATRFLKMEIPNFSFDLKTNKKNPLRFFSPVTEKNPYDSAFHFLLE